VTWEEVHRRMFQVFDHMRQRFGDQPLTVDDAEYLERMLRLITDDVWLHAFLTRERARTQGLR